ncbi:uncharacterized protein LOC111193616 isoform X2 [Astyanax mexicanus]|uniref:uncharacterized protein LOC111193616 isoform X2 n=1 Tax=Astyanax mexicanus TaxID=7994 RepID=UPI0020CAE44E|nr:uncharacterized protein LOC111193616 isoform X2 [Astyanax mexicanus]
MSNQSTWAESFQGPGHAQGVLPPISAPTVQHKASLWPMSNQSTWVESSQGPGHAQGVLPHVSAPTVKETLQCPRSNQSTWAESSQGTGHAQGVLPHVSAVDRTVLEALREIDLKIGYLTSLESFIGGRRILPTQQLAGEEEVNFIPLNSIEDLENMEERLQNNELRQRMISMLSLSGGASMQKTIWRIASKLLTADLAKNLNWCGRGNKRGLKKTLFGQMIIGAAMKNPILPAPTEADAEKCLKRLPGWHQGGVNIYFWL